MEEAESSPSSGAGEGGGPVRKKRRNAIYITKGSDAEKQIYDIGVTHVLNNEVIAGLSSSVSLAADEPAAAEVAAPPTESSPTSHHEIPAASEAAPTAPSVGSVREEAGEEPSASDGEAPPPSIPQPTQALSVGDAPPASRDRSDLTDDEKNRIARLTT